LWDPELRELAKSLDLVVCNLECCISERGRPTSLIEGKPFFFRGPPAAVEALKAMNIRAAGLANNHALDFGEEALEDTLELLGAAGILAAGAGFGRDAARSAAIVPAGDLRVGLTAVTDHPVEYAAVPDRWGVAPASIRDGPPSWLLDQIAAVRERTGVSQAVMAAFLNVAVSTISQWERGERHPTGAALKLLHVVRQNGIEVLR